MTEGEILQLLVRALTGQIDQMQDQGSMDVYWHVDAIDRAEHLENERAARDCDCE